MHPLTASAFAAGVQSVERKGPAEGKAAAGGSESGVSEGFRL